MEMLSKAGPGHSEVVRRLTFFLGFFFLSLFNSGYILWRNIKLEMVVSALGDRLGAEIILDLLEKWSRKIREFSSIKKHPKVKPSPTVFAYTWSKRKDDPTLRQQHSQGDGGCSICCLEGWGGGETLQAPGWGRGGFRETLPLQLGTAHTAPRENPLQEKCHCSSEVL